MGRDISTASGALSRTTISGIGVNIWENVAKEWTERLFNNYRSKTRYGARGTSAERQIACRMSIEQPSLQQSTWFMAMN